MLRKVLLLMAAALFFILANTSFGCTVSVDGQKLGTFSTTAVLKAERAARRALDELAAGEAKPPALKKRYRLCLATPEGNTKELCHRLILSSGQALLLHRVSAGGETLGYVECGAVLKERLHHYAYTHMPPGADMCRLSAAVTTQPVYCRSAVKWGYEAMLNKILEVSPLIYGQKDAAIGR